MATLSAWKFDTVHGADEAEKVLLSLQKQDMIRVIEAAVVSWPAHRRKPKTRQLHHLAGPGALGGAFWGFLFGLLFFVPILGMAVGAGMGAIAGSMAQVGVSEDFIDRVRDKVTPGTSALFLLTDEAVQDKVFPAFAHLHPELITTNMSMEEEERLRAAFAQEPD
jgi:uncharacterized membrane protein